MLKRKMYDTLLAWKQQRHGENINKCLLVKGARQVGKSFIIREFGSVIKEVTYQKYARKK